MDTDWVFIDRGLVDAAVALQYATRRAARGILAPLRTLPSKRLSNIPLAKIYVTDDALQHGLNGGGARERGQEGTTSLRSRP